jgi:predicted nucleic acid-binding protein
MIFVDTSGLYAYLDHADERQRIAASAMTQWITAETELLTSSYVIVETVALAQRRLGAGPAAEFLRDLVPLLRTIWVGPELHERAAAAFLSAPSRRISLVDWTSFLLMRDEGIETAFAFDADFEAQGFRTIPS